MKQFITLIYFISFLSSAKCQILDIRKSVPDIEIRLNLDIDTFNSNQDIGIPSAKTELTFYNNTLTKLKLSNFIFYSATNVKNIIQSVEGGGHMYFFPVVEYFIDKIKRWTSMDFETLVHSSDPQTIIPFDGAEIFLAPKNFFVFKNITLLDMVVFPKTGLYRTKLIFVTEVDSQTMFVKHTNYEEFYVR